MCRKNGTKTKLKALCLNEELITNELGELMAQIETIGYNLMAIIKTLWQSDQNTYL